MSTSPQKKATSNTQIIIDVASLNRIKVTKLTQDDLQSLCENGQTVLSQLSVVQLHLLTEAQIQGLTSLQLKSKGKNGVISAQLSIVQVGFLNSSQVQGLTGNQLSLVNHEDNTIVRYLSTKQIGYLSKEQVSNLTEVQLKEIDASGFAVLSDLSGEQINYLTKKQIEGLTTAQLKGTDVKNTFILADLSKAQIRYLTQSQVEKLTPLQLTRGAANEKTVLFNLNKKQIGFLTKIQVASFTNEQINTGSDGGTLLSRMTSDQVKALSSNTKENLTDKQLNSKDIDGQLISKDIVDRNNIDNFDHMSTYVDLGSAWNYEKMKSTMAVLDHSNTGDVKDYSGVEVNLSFLNAYGSNKDGKHKSSVDTWTSHSDALGQGPNKETDVSDPKLTFQDFAKEQVKLIQNGGGIVQIAFGGETGSVKPVDKNTDGTMDFSVYFNNKIDGNYTEKEAVNELHDKYNEEMNRYGVSRLNFDIEGDLVNNMEANSLRDKALVLLQKTRSDLVVTYTLPVGLNGLQDNAKTLLINASKAGVKLHTLGLMTMHFGDDGSRLMVSDNKTEGDLAITAIKDTQTWLNSDEMKDSMKGIKINATLSPGIRTNESPFDNNYATVADITQLGNFMMNDPQVSGLGIWSVNSDAGREVNSMTAWSQGEMSKAIFNSLDYSSK